MKRTTKSTRRKNPVARCHVILHNSDTGQILSNLPENKRNIEALRRAAKRRTNATGKAYVVSTVCGERFTGDILVCYKSPKPPWGTRCHKPR